MVKKLLCIFLSASAVLFGAGVDDAKGYHKNSNVQWNAAMDLLASVEWKGDEKILDVGSGDGKITAYIAENCSKSAVVGVDVSASMVRFASAQYNQDVHSHLVFLQADAANLPFEQQFDAVLSFSTLHWVVDQSAALTSIYRSLVSGGKARILTVEQAPMNIGRVAEQLIGSEKWASLFPDYRPQRVYFSREEYVGSYGEGRICRGSCKIGMELYGLR